MAEMTAAHAIERAEHALRTGQPNLAVIYMRRAMVLVAQDREATRRAILRARVRGAGPLELLLISFEQIAEAAKEAAQDFVQAWRQVAATAQNNYALAGPSKGGN